MAGRILVSISAFIVFWLGLMHMRLTFVGDKLTPADGSLQENMQRVAPVISAETTMWKAWIGFNASHSLGALLFGLIYGYLALRQPALLFQAWFLLAVGAALLGCYSWLGVRYWFSTPLIAIGVAALCYLVGAILGSLSYRA